MDRRDTRWNGGTQDETEDDQMKRRGTRWNGEGSERIERYMKERKGTGCNGWDGMERDGVGVWEVVPLGSRHVIPLHSIKSLSVPSKSLSVSAPFDPSSFHLVPLRSI